MLSKLQRNSGDRNRHEQGLMKTEGETKRKNYGLIGLE